MVNICVAVVFLLNYAIRAAWAASAKHGTTDYVDLLTSAPDVSKRAYFGCTELGTYRCHKPLPPSLLKINQSIDFELYNYHNVRLRVTGFGYDGSIETLFDSDEHCPVIFQNNCSAYDALVGDDYRFGCRPCALKLNLYYRGSNKFSDLIVEVQRATLGRTCGAIILRIDYTVNSENFFDSLLHRVAPSFAEYFTIENDVTCRSRDKALLLGLTSFLCAGPASGSSLTSPSFASELVCAPSAYSEDLPFTTTNVYASDFYPLDMGRERGGFSEDERWKFSGHAVNRTVLIGIVMPMVAFIAAACLVWCYRQKCGPTLLPNRRHNSRNSSQSRRPCVAEPGLVMPVPAYTDLGPGGAPPPSYEDCMLSLGLARTTDNNNGQISVITEADDGDDRHLDDPEQTFAPLLHSPASSKRTLSPENGGNHGNVVVT